LARLHAADGFQCPTDEDLDEAELGALLYLLRRGCGLPHLGRIAVIYKDDVNLGIKFVFVL
jgi:hypothetical protein